MKKILYILQYILLKCLFLSFQLIPTNLVSIIGGFLFKDSGKDKIVSKHNIETPILIGHGVKDDVIPIDKSKIAYNKLLKEGANVKFYDYNGGHKISISYIKEVVKIINESE